MMIRSRGYYLYIRICRCSCPSLQLYFPPSLSLSREIYIHVVMMITMVMITMRVITMMVIIKLIMIWRIMVMVVVIIVPAYFASEEKKMVRWIFSNTKSEDMRRWKKTWARFGISLLCSVSLRCPVVLHSCHPLNRVFQKVCAQYINWLRSFFLSQKVCTWSIALVLVLALGTCTWYLPPTSRSWSLWWEGRTRTWSRGTGWRCCSSSNSSTTTSWTWSIVLCKSMISLEQSRTCHPASRRGFCRRNSWKSRFGLTEIKAFFLTKEYSLCETSLVKPLFVLTIITISVIIIIFLLLIIIIVIISYIREIPWYGPQVRMKPRISTPVTCQCNGDAFLTNKDFRSQYLANSKDSFSAAPAHYLEL